MITELIDKIQELQFNRYQEIRRRNPEFKNFDDREITMYINLYDRNKKDAFAPHDTLLQTIGAIILIINWFIFNAGSTGSVNLLTPSNNVMNSFATTAIAASVGTLTTLFGRLIEVYLIDDEPQNRYDLPRVLNGTMAACVGITASSHNIGFLGSIIIGFVSSIIYMLTSRIAARTQLDDPMEVSIIHGVCGFWGVIFVGFFDLTDGLIYTGSFKQLQIQLIGAVSLLLFSAGAAFLFFFTVKFLNHLRVGEIFEILG